MIVNLRESLNTRDRKSVNGNSKYYDLVNLYESCNLSADNKKTLAKMINNNASDKAIYSFLYECYEGKEDIKEDTVKKDGKWVNKGKEGTHGEFKTKKAADAQRKAMFANGYKGESLKENDGARSNTSEFFELIDRYGLDEHELFVDLISNFMSDDEVGEFVEYIKRDYDIDDDDFDESLKENYFDEEDKEHEECVGNNCTDEHDLFPEEKYFTIVVTRSDDGEDEIIDDVTKEIADKYIDDLKRDNDEFFSHAKVLDHNGKVVNSWEYLEEDYEMDRFSVFLDDDRKQRLKMQARKDKERAESIFSIHGNVFRKNGIDTDEVVVARNLSWQEAKDKLDRMQYNSNAIDMYADVWIYNDTLDREEEHWDTKGYFKDEENNYYESCSKDFEEAVKSKKSFSVKDRLKKLIPDLDI